MNDEETLAALVRGSPWHWRVVCAIEATGAPDAWLAAGAIRDLVWDERFGAGFRPELVADVDVVFFDEHDLTPEADARVEAWLTTREPDLAWQAKNQAAVHLWYPEKFGQTVTPLRSIEEAVATFPETATAVAVRRQGDDIEVLAPLGLGDLLSGVWRCNPARVSPEEASARLARKQPQQRWPGVRVAPRGAPEVALEVDPAQGG